ncbi:LysR family transcriptional regulator [uncultured Shewanella sp.]|uniref:LysR family transcriptional regulator n=1 Tax=uncultured Shewanella sp. TaxID=173975 RepID=UPI0026125B5D|nr:LysR family transcriptional regulator [uncultured Shewanella sp.]
MFQYLRHMSVFVAIVEQGSITAAAETLGLSKSVLSLQLTKLEKELNVNLLRRTTRKQILTPAGKAFYNECTKILKQVDNAWQQARDSQHQLIGEVKITAPHAFMHTLIAPAIGTLIHQHPKLNLHLIDNDERVDLMEHHIDIAIRVGELPSSDLKQRFLGTFCDVLCASPSFFEENNISIKQYQTLNYIGNHWQGKQVIHQVQTPSSINTMHFTVSSRVYSMQSLISLCISGAGIAAIPDFIAQPLIDSNQLIPIFTNLTLKPNPVHALHGYGMKAPQIVTTCIETIQQAFKQHLISNNFK